MNQSSLDKPANSTSGNASLLAEEEVFESSGEEYLEEGEGDYFGGSTEEEVKEIEYMIEEALLANIALENDSTLFEMGHQFEDFVFHCSFRGYDCR